MTRTSPLRARAAIAVAALVSAVGVAGCAAGPDFTRPTVGPTAYRNDPPGIAGEAPAPADPQTLAYGRPVPDDWWAALQSPELDRWMHQAIARNPSLSAADATLAQAREAVDAQRGALYPQVDLTAGVGRQKYGKEFLGPLQAPPAFTYYAFGPSARYTFDVAGGVARSVEEREAEVEFQRQRLRAAHLSLTGNIARQAIAMAAARAQLRTLEGLVAEDRRNVSLVRQSFDAGYGTRVELLSAESQLASDAALLPPTQKAVDVARHALAVLGGDSPAEATVPEFDLDDFMLPRELPVSLPAEMARQRPDILAAEAQLHAATAAVGVATADLYPRITLNASGGPQALTVASLFDRGNLVWSLTSGIVAPIFDGGTLRARRRASVDALTASAAAYRSTVLDAVREVADVLASIEHDGQSMAAQSRSLAIAEQSVDLARLSYQAGNSGILQLLDAERLVQRARLESLQARVRRVGDTIDLYLSLGGVPAALGASPAGS